ncbi:hypothetical protein MHY29_08685, partial [Micrococcus sp. ACRRV]|uniref:hypothetical protein n=1 Tax=Micrococcus sp. ACRRV TaxID=2918203 RepID=UPI001EF2CD42
SRAPRLAAAVLASGLAAAALAAPASAEQAYDWTDDHGYPHGLFFGMDPESVDEATFQTFYGFDPADLTVTVSPSDAEGTPTGPAAAVPFTAVDVLDGGTIDVLETRRILGEAGTGTVVYHVFSGDQEELDMALVVGPDADLADATGGALVAAPGPVRAVLGDMPLSWSTDVVMAPGVRAMEVRYPVDPALFDNVHPFVTTEAAHGTVVTFRDREDLSVRTWYVPDAGFTGTDTFSLDLTSDHVAHLPTVTVHVGQELPAAAAGAPDAQDGVLGGMPLDVEDPAIAAMLQQMGALPPAPETTVPETTVPETTVPAEQHTRPGKVQTGGEPIWWLAGAAALGAGALVAARRRPGMAR